MIKNDIQYRITKGRAATFRGALLDDPEPDRHVHPLMVKASRDGMQSILDELDAEIAEYEASLKSRISS